MPCASETLGGQLKAVREDIKKLFEKKDAATGRYDWTAEDREKYHELEGKAADLHTQHIEAVRLEDAERQNKAGLDDLGRARHAPPGYHPAGGGHGDHATEVKDIGRLIVDHPEFKRWRPGNPVVIEIPDFDSRSFGLKTVMTEAAGFAPANYRTDMAIPFAVRRPTVGNLIPQDPTTLQAITWMEETTFTNNAAPVAEGAVKPESASQWTPRTTTVETIATTLPVTEQQLADVPQIEGIIRDRLTTMVNLTEEDQLLNGNGTSPNLQGFLTKTGVQVQSAAGVAAPDAILQGMILVMYTGFAEASGLVMNPNNWIYIRTLKTSTGDYIYGSPSIPGPQTVWGMPAVVTPAMTANTALTGDFRTYSHISRRLGIRIDVGLVNDDFKRNQKTLRCETRLSLEIYRPAAFAKITNLPTGIAP